MKRYLANVGGQHVNINAVETTDDIIEFSYWVANQDVLGLDTETTGLDIYSQSFRLRTVQFGTNQDTFVIPVAEGFTQTVKVVLNEDRRFIVHNAAYDLQVLDRCLGVPMSSMWPKTTDTAILSHLVDSRGSKEGGVGHGLEDLTRHYLCADTADGIKSSMRELAKELKVLKRDVWKIVPYDNPTYQRYAGLDPALAFMIYHKLMPLVPGTAKSLIEYEHEISRVCTSLEKHGFLLDVEYTEELSDHLAYQEQEWMVKAYDLGVENVNSTEQVADALEKLGVKIRERTPSGKRKVDNLLLDSLIEGDGPAKLLAEAVTEAKKAGKWRKTWTDGFLEQRDVDDRCHASIRTLGARTARMSITGIPAQTLPSGDPLIRRCFLADEGHRIASIDYQAQELRVLAALSGDPTMQKAFRDGLDLHQITADAASVPRSVGKTTNFAYVYGSGAGNIAKQCGIPFMTAKRVIEGFEQSYPLVKRYSDQLQAEARRNGYVTTPTGRRLYVDQNRVYSSLNYMIQSTSRDITAAALLRLDEQGYTPYVRLVIHDEVLASLPEEYAQWGAETIAQIMATTIGGVHIGTDPEIGKRSWGSLYGADT